MPTWPLSFSCPSGCLAYANAAARLSCNECFFWRAKQEESCCEGNSSLLRHIHWRIKDVKFSKTTSADSQLVVLRDSYVPWWFVARFQLFNSPPNFSVSTLLAWCKIHLCSAGCKCLSFGRSKRKKDFSRFSPDFAVLDPEGAVSATAPCLVIVLVIQSPLTLRPCLHLVGHFMRFS